MLFHSYPLLYLTAHPHTTLTHIYNYSIPIINACMLYVSARMLYVCIGTRGPAWHLDQNLSSRVELHVDSIVCIYMGKASDSCLGILHIPHAFLKHD